MDEKAIEARFRAGILRPTDKREVRIAVNAFSLAAVRGYPGLIEDMLTVSKRRVRDPLNLFRLQMSMMNEILALESATGEHKRELESEETANRLTEEERLGRETEIYFNKLVTKAIRSVGDGMVWRLLGHDRAAYYLLAQGHGPAAVATSGLPAEVRRLAHTVAQDEGIPLLSSLTNCVRFGDLIVFKEQEDGGLQTTLEEVKSREDRTPRFTRQRKRLGEVITLLEEREGRIGELEVNIDTRNVAQESYLPAVLNLIQETLNRGAAGRMFDNYLRVECFAIHAPGAERDSNWLARESLADMEPWSRGGDFVSEGCNLELKQMTRNCAPYSVFPYPDRIRAALLTNQVGVRSYLNISEVFRRFSAAGWKVETDIRTGMVEALRDGKDPRDVPFARLRKGRCTVALPPSVATRLLFEYLKPRTVVRELELIAQFPREEEKRPSLSYYPGEMQIWD